MTQHYTMLQRNLLYTGVTRGKRLVVLVGQKKKAVAIAVRSVSGGAVGRSLASGYARLLPRSGRTRCEDYGDAAVTLVCRRQILLRTFNVVSGSASLGNQ
jgi:hypothetical protein